MLRIKEFHKDGTKIELTELEKFGFKKHKHDRENVLISKWTRNWIEADSVDGHKWGSDGWEFYELVEILENKELKLNDFWSWDKKKLDKIIDDLIKADLVEKVEE